MTFLPEVGGGEKVFEKRVADIAHLPHFSILADSLAIEKVGLLLQHLLSLAAVCFCPVILCSTILGLVLQHEHHCLIHSTAGIFARIQAKPDNSITPRTGRE